MHKKKHSGEHRKMHKAHEDKPHKRIRPTCVYCGVLHGEEYHRFHGHGAYARTHG
jgi:hypothetical protein